MKLKLGSIELETFKKSERPVWVRVNNRLNPKQIQDMKKLFVFSIMIIMLGCTTSEPTYFTVTKVKQSFFQEKDKVIYVVYKHNSKTGWKSRLTSPSPAIYQVGDTIYLTKILP